MFGEKSLDIFKTKYSFPLIFFQGLLRQNLETLKVKSLQLKYFITVIVKVLSSNV